MLDLQLTKQFKKDYKKILKQGKNTDELWSVIEKLQNDGTLNPQYRDHPLTGNYKNHRECHLNPDWLLIYKIDKCKVILTAVRTGSHSELY